MIGIIYIVHWGIQKFRGQGAPFVGPYIGGILQTILLGYATLVSVSFDLLRCVPIGSEKRWKRGVFSVVAVHFDCFYCDVICTFRVCPALGTN